MHDLSRLMTKIFWYKNNPDDVVKLYSKLIDWQ